MLEQLNCGLSDDMQLELIYSGDEQYPLEQEQEQHDEIELVDDDDDEDDDTDEGQLEDVD